MIISKPNTSKQMPDGIYLGRIVSVTETTSRANPNARQLEITLSLNTRDQTRVWVNQSVKGIDTLIKAGVASETPDGVSIKEADHLVGLVVTQGKALLTPASVAVGMAPHLKPLFEQAALKYSFK